MKKKIVKTTDWLTRRYTEEELDKMKEEAIKEAEVELQKKQREQIMNKQKHIKEITNELIFTKNYGTLDAVAKHLYESGYRKQEWISVEDRLPDTDEVLAYCREGYIGHAAPKKQGLDKMDWDVFFNIAEITHWMPLPEPPKMKGGAE